LHREQTQDSWDIEDKTMTLKLNRFEWKYLDKGWVPRNMSKEIKWEL